MMSFWCSTVLRTRDPGPKPAVSIQRPESFIHGKVGGSLRRWEDAQTGNLVTQEYRVEGPVSIMLTTTAIEIDEELLNRCLILTVDEGREQTEAIHRLQRHKRTLDGLLA